MNFLDIFLGVASGLTTGVLVYLLVSYIQNKLNEKRLIKYFKYEIEINIEKIKSFISELERYKDKILVNSLKTYFGWFYFSEILLNSVNQLFFTNLIYKKLKFKEIEKLQRFIKDFSPASEDFINKQISANKELADKSETKQQVLDQVNWWKMKFEDYIISLQDIKNRLK